MVDVTLQGDTAVFEPRGLSKLWTLRRRIAVPLAAIRDVRRAPPGGAFGWWKGWRLPGTHLPGVIVAGSYYASGAWTFWDVRGAGERAIVVELDPDAEVEARGTLYRRLVVDVADPDAEVARLSAAVARQRGYGLSQ